jgi:hypothetical protein
MSQLLGTLKRLMSPTRAVMVAAIGAGAISGCSNSTDAGARSPTQLSFTTTSATASAAAAALAPITSGGHTLDLTHVTLTIARAELKRTSSDGCNGDDEGDDDHAATTSTMEDCAEVKVGPTTVDLPLTGGMVTVPANAIPAGTFHQLELRVSSVRLQGTFDTKAFDVTLPVNARGEIEFATPVVVTDGTPTSITVNVPANTWLVNPDGSLIDPNAILTNPALLTTVRNRVAASFRAFEDEDHDGRDDHDHGHGGGDGD